MSKETLTEADEGDLNTLIKYVKEEQTKKIFNNITCSTTGKTILECDCDNCKMSRLNLLVKE